MPESVLIEGGQRQGRTLANERLFREKIAAGLKVYTKRNGVFFSVEVNDEGGIVYTALVNAPEGL